MAETNRTGREARTETEVSEAEKDAGCSPLAEGLHMLYDAPIDGYWVTTRGYPNGRVGA